MKARLGSERGSVLVTTVLFLPVLVLIMVFVIDVGNWWTHKRHVQLQADAAALAGGDVFATCFPPGPRNDSAMRNEANTYFGLNSLTGQFGSGNQGSEAGQPLYNTNTGGGDDTVNGDSCASGQFDVKVAESNLPLFFNTVVPGLSVVPAIKAHARVEIFPVNGGNPGLPLAVADVNPTDVAVTFFNIATNAALGTVHLNKQGPVNGLNWWTTNAVGQLPANPITINVPSSVYSNIGMRVGMGRTVPNCNPGNNGVAGQYICYDYSGLPLTTIRGYMTSPAGTDAAPKERAVWETTTGCGVNSGTPFISDASGQSSCTAVVQAQIDFGTATPGCPAVCIFANGQAMTYNGSGNWSTGLGVAAGTGGTSSVNLTWSNTNKKTCGNGHQTCSNQSFGVLSPAQQVYSADSHLDVTGPVMAITLSENGGGGTGSPYSFAAGTSHQLTVNVGLTQDFNSITPPSGNTMLRFIVNSGSSSASSLINCAPTYPDSVLYGCSSQYSPNPTDSCNPDPNPGPFPDCIPTAPGVKTSIRNFLNQRFACTQNNWGPNFDVSKYPNDPRIVQLLLTDFIFIAGQNGTETVPVNHLATFYVTGWFGSSCAQNEAPPGGDSSKGDIWGHFIAYVNTFDVGPPGGPHCPLNQPVITPCIPELTR